MFLFVFFGGGGCYSCLLTNLILFFGLFFGDCMLFYVEADAHKDRIGKVCLFIYLGGGFRDCCIMTAIGKFVFFPRI